jgi:small subunit ribosomal protein S17
MAKKNLDIGFEATQPNGTCSDEKCPWHGHLKVRGRVFKGRVKSTKAANTAIVEWDYYNYIPKYERYERRKSSVAAHKPHCIEAKTGDTVRIGECRPISKMKRFVVIEKF